MLDTIASRLDTIRIIQGQIVALLSIGHASHAQLLYAVETKYSERDLVAAERALLSAEIIERNGDAFALVA